MVTAVHAPRVGAVEPLLAPGTLTRCRRLPVQRGSCGAAPSRAARCPPLGVDDAVRRGVVFGEDSGAAIRSADATTTERADLLRHSLSGHQDRPSLSIARSRGVVRRRVLKPLGAMARSPVQTSESTCREAEPRRQGRKHRAHTVPARRRSPTDHLIQGKAQNDRRDGQRGSRRGGSGHLPPETSIPALGGESRSGPFPPRRRARRERRAGDGSLGRESGRRAASLPLLVATGCARTAASPAGTRRLREERP